MEYTISYRPQQNGVSERLNWSIMDKARVMIEDAVMDKNMWCEAVLAALSLLSTGAQRKNTLRDVVRSLYPDRAKYQKERNEVEPTKVHRGDPQAFRHKSLQAGLNAYSHELAATEVIGGRRA